MAAYLMMGILQKRGKVRKVRKGGKEKAKGREVDSLPLTGD
jgi:hypothetical protein